MPDQPTHPGEILNLYVKFMEEIKRRIDTIQRVVGGQFPLPGMVAFELCYLQLRKICEVFALACLAAHGEISETRTGHLSNTYDADEIIKRLTRLHPEFYPVPGRQQIDPGTEKVSEVVRVASCYLTKDELLRLYGECGNYLHRGTLRQLLSNWEPAPDFTRIQSAVQQIIALLNHHQIQLRQPDKQLWVLMHSKQDGQVKGAVMQRTERQQRQQSER